MSRALRLALCLIVVASLPLVAGAAVPTCDTSMQPAVVDFDLASILPSTVLSTTTANLFSCPAAFSSAEYCNDCWQALNQCSGPNCYFCTEICLGRLGCWVP